MSNESGTYKEIGTNHFRNARALKEDGNNINWADWLSEGSNFFNEFQVANKRAQITYNSDLPLSNRRDILTQENGGTVTKQGPEYRLRATSTTDSKAVLRSAQRGNYQSGAVFEPGVGIRTDGTPTGTAYYQVGYYDGNNGILLRQDSEGIKLVVINDSVETEVLQENWNYDTLDGSGGSSKPSEFNLDLSNGVVVQTPFVYYGYGPILLQLKVRDKSNREHLVNCHLFNNAGSTTIDEPNLPLWQEVNSGDSGAQLDLYVGGRQMSVWGTTDNVERTTFARRSVTGVGSTDWVPVISVREKSEFSQVPIRLSGVTVIPSDDMEWEIHRDATLTDASFTYLGNMSDDEIATEWDISAGTTYTEGEAIYGGIVSGGNRVSISPQALPRRPIYEGDTYTLAVRSLGSTASAIALLKLTEDW